MRSLIVAAIALGIAAPTVHAQPGLTPPRPTAKQRGTAILATTGGMVLPVLVGGIAGDHWRSPGAEKTVTLVVATAIVFPSAGHWYTGELGVTGMVIRAAGAIPAGIATVAWVDGDRSNSNSLLIKLGSLTVLTGVGYDFVTSARAVDRWNREHDAIVTMTKIGDGYGVGLAGTF